MTATPAGLTSHSTLRSLGVSVVVHSGIVTQAEPSSRSPQSVHGWSQISSG